MFGIFFILFKSRVIDKPCFCECVQTRSFLFWQITQNSKQNKKKSQIGICSEKKETCTKFQRKSLKSTVVGARQSFKFFSQNTWFLKNNRTLSKVLYWILHYVISITKL